MLLQEETILSRADLEKLSKCIEKIIELSADSTNIYFGIPANIGSEIRKQVYAKDMKHLEVLQTARGGSYEPNEDIEPTSFDVLVFEKLLTLQLIFSIDETVECNFNYLGNNSLLKSAKANFTSTLHADIAEKIRSDRPLSWNDALELLESKSFF